MNSSRPISYGRQSIGADDIAAVVETLQSDWLTQGPAIARFETQLSTYLDAPHTVAVSNGTAALHLACMALGLKAGDRVLTTPITFAASANAARYCGASVEFVDIDPSTRLMDLDLLEKRLSQAPAHYYRGIIAVDFAGHPVDAERLSRLARHHDLWIIEDACHALGARYQDAKGTWFRTGSGHHSDLTVFSFHPVKHITTGEGGAITTRNRALFESLLRLRTHGISKTDAGMQEHGGWFYDMAELGYNYRLCDIQAALGYSQLQHASTWLERRQQIAATYDTELAPLPIRRPSCASNVSHAYHLYVIETERRRELYDFLKTRHIYTQVHYIPVHTLSYYRQHAPDTHCPHAEAYYAQCLSLPLYQTMSEDDQHRVIESLFAFYK